MLHIGGQAVAGRKHQEKKRIGQRVGSLYGCNLTGQPGLHTAPTWASCLGVRQHQRAAVLQDSYAGSPCCSAAAVFFSNYCQCSGCTALAQTNTPAACLRLSVLLRRAASCTLYFAKGPTNGARVARVFDALTQQRMQGAKGGAALRRMSMLNTSAPLFIASFTRRTSAQNCAQVVVYPALPLWLQHCR